MLCRQGEVGKPLQPTQNTDFSTQKRPPNLSCCGKGMGVGTKDSLSEIVLHCHWCALKIVPELGLA